MRGRQRFPTDVLERRGESRKRVFVDRQPRRERMTAKAAYKPGRPLGHQIEPVAEIESANRPARAAELALRAARENDRGSVVAVLQAGRHDADDTLVPFRPVDA